MRANPGWVLQAGMRKLAAGFSWRLNPHREPLAQAAYAVGYVPVAVLGILGMVLARRRPETALVGLLFLAFMAVTFVFWAHTSHRTYLDVYWIVFAGVGHRSLQAAPGGENSQRLSQFPIRATASCISAAEPA